jgi:hypothetical protein
VSGPAHASGDCRPSRCRRGRSRSGNSAGGRNVTAEAIIGLVFLRSSGSFALASFDDPAPSCAIQPCSGIRFNGHSEPALFGCQLPTICP